MENKSFNKLNKNLHQDVSNLWDECFGDLSIAKQRLIKAYGTISSKQAYSHHPKEAITIKKLQTTPIKIFEGDSFFKKGSPQQEYAQNITDKIVKRLKNGNNQTSAYLKEFLKDKKITVGVDKQLADDAGFFGYNPLTKEIYVDLCAGLFYYSNKYPELFNEDSLARTIGHEIGHAVEQLNRSSKTQPNFVGYSSNGWEVESFCDAFGTALCVGAGYNLTPTLTKLKQFEEKELANHNEANPHPTLLQRRKLLELMLKAYEYENSSNAPIPFSDKVSAINWNDKGLEKNKESAKQR